MLGFTSKPASGCTQATLFIFFSSSLAPHSQMRVDRHKTDSQDIPFDEEFLALYI